MKREHHHCPWCRNAWPTVIIASLIATVTACSGGAEAPKSSAAGTPPSTAASGNDSWKPTVKTASLPGDPCEWVSVADVETVMGSKLAEPPTKEDGCRYTLVIPAAVAAKRDQAKAMQEKIRKAFGNPTEEPQGVMANAMNDPRSYAVTVSVDVKGEVTGEIGADAGFKQLGLDATGPDTAKSEPPKAPNDWDDMRRISTVFMGRVGHVRVSVEAQSPDVPREPMQKLAEIVRDRIPELPFAVTNPYQVMQLDADKDPCSLLTRAEAEAVLGPLAMDPYRSSSNWPPLAHGKGYACAYYTAGHHVFVLAPTWKDGAESFKLEKGIGGLVGLVAPQESVVMKGPWDQAQIGGSGALVFLKGDQLLEVHYRTSRATRGDAIKLAAIAMPRLTP